MGNFTIRTVNATLEAWTEAPEAIGVTGAEALAIQGAVAMLGDEVTAGSRSAAVELSVVDAGDRCVSRLVVALSVAPLVTG